MYTKLWKIDKHKPNIDFLPGWDLGGVAILMGVEGFNGILARGEDP